MECGILFLSSLFHEYSNLECVRVPVKYGIDQTEYVIRILVAVSQEYVNTYLHVAPSPSYLS